MSKQAAFRSRKIALIAVACALLMSSAAQAQNLSFAAGRDFPASATDTTVNLVASGDFRGNGNTDVVTVTTSPLQSGSRISILLGNGDGTLRTPATITSSAQLINAIAVGDFNGDGKPDLVTVSTATPPSVSVFLGNGDGTFRTPVVTSLATPPQLTGGLAVADFNKDGKSDVALTASAPQVNAGSVEVLIGNGDGTFKTPVTYPIAALSSLIAVGDLSADGTPDLITAGGTQLSVLLGNSDGTFQAALNIDLSATCATTASLMVADFNKDGKDDLAVGTAVLLSSGGGAFQPPVCNTIVPNFAADFNHDGIPDLATLGRGATIFLGKGDGTFSESASYSSSLQAPAVGADFNGDGKLDLAGPALGNNVTVVLGNGDGTLQSPATLARSDVTAVIGLRTTGVAATDLRSDGKTDLVLFGESSEGVGFVVTYLGNGNGGFQTPVVSAAGNMTASGIIGDFNQDGKPDLAVTGFSDVVAVLLGNGDGTFQPQVQYNTNLGGTFSVLGAGDFNGDGKQDLVVAGSTSNAPAPGAPGTIEFLLGNGDGTFGFPTGVATVPNQVAALAVGDFNGDGTSDVAVAGVGGNGTTNAISIFLGNTSGIFQPPTILALAGQPTALTVADFNQDGKPDLAVTFGIASNQVQIFLGNGDGTFSSKGIFVTGMNPNSIVAADFNGDGKLDLATTGSDGLSVLAGNGDGTFQAAIDYDSSLNPVNLAAADFNSDAKTDIAVLSGAGVALFLNTSGSNAPPFSLSATGATTMTVTAGQTATLALQVTPAGSFVGPVALSCNGAPATTTCSVSASSITFQGASVPFTVTVTTTANGALVPVTEKLPLSPLSYLAATFGIGLLVLLFGIFSPRRQLSLKWGALAAVLSFVLLSSACGGGSGSGGHPPPTNGTPSGSFQVVVNASAGTVTQSIKLTVTAR